MIDLKNKKVLITGATGGIGGSIAKKFLSLNAEVLGTGTNSDKLEKLKKNFSKIKIKKFDISSHSQIEKFIDEVSEELGGLDILVNNAGINRDNLSLRMKDDEWQKVIDINLTSTFLLSKYAIKKMMKNNIWKSNKHYINSWSYREYWSIKLCCFKSRYNWNVKKSRN